MAEVAAVVGAIAAATSAGAGVANYLASQDAAHAQSELAKQQQAALKAEQDTEKAEAARMATTGANFGFSEQTTRGIATGLGFGGAPQGSANTGRAQITGGL